MGFDQISLFGNSIKRLKQIFYKIYLRIIYKEKYWQKEWDWEARQLGDKFFQKNCRRSPATKPEVYDRIEKALDPKSNDVFLDVGCAAGPVIKNFKKVNMSYGMDISLELLRTANPNCVHENCLQKQLYHLYYYSFPTFSPTSVILRLLPYHYS